MAQQSNKIFVLQVYEISNDDHFNAVFVGKDEAEARAKAQEAYQQEENEMAEMDNRKPETINLADMESGKWPEFAITGWFVEV